MLNTYVAETDEQGNLQLPKGLRLTEGCRILITVLDDASKPKANDEALLSESALREDWDKPEEDEAWDCLIQEK